MTPTLLGRWQTRFFLLATVGLIVTLFFYSGLLGSHEGNPIYFWILIYVGIFGFFWDILYNYLQKLLWDHDWPGAIQLIACIAEGLVLGLCFKYIGLPLVNNFDVVDFIFHYSLVSFVAFLASWVVMRLLFPRWRFRGGVWIG
ncbi:MAG: hypothetical protein RLZZ574_1987 [Cyanobacteriota bacterium]|jgi:hypothetical protein